jgi:hypothetical protein
MVEMVKYGKSDPDGLYYFLVEGDYVAAMSLTLSITDTGQLAPSLKFPSVTDVLSINAGFNLQNSRTHTFKRNMRFSFKEIYSRWQDNNAYGECPSEAATNLSGKLGIRNIVLLQMSAPSTATSAGVEGEKEFGGSIGFKVARNVNSAGPTWALSGFVGPGGLAKLERSSDNTLDIAFSVGSKPSDRSGKPDRADRDAAQRFLDQLQIERALRED